MMPILPDPLRRGDIHHHIFVDDSFVYSNRMEYIREYEQKIRKHFEITTDPEAESFLGVTFTCL